MAGFLTSHLPADCLEIGSALDTTPVGLYRVRVPLPFYKSKAKIAHMLISNVELCAVSSVAYH